jgi:hypothetical protein
MSVRLSLFASCVWVLCTSSSYLLLAYCFARLLFVAVERELEVTERIRG